MNRSLNTNRGSIEVICGSMFSGKTEELLRRVRRAHYGGLRTILFKPKMDDRYSSTEVVSHDSNRNISTPIEHPNEIENLSSGYDLIAIDEAQFFDESLIAVCERLADQGLKVIVSGLEKDYRRQGFGPMPGLMVKAEFVSKLHAICVDCGELANYSFRKHHSNEQVQLGSKEEYQALCRSCYNQKINK